MDFASLMSKEISKAKAPASATPDGKKYKKRADEEAERQAAYAAHQDQLEKERLAHETQKRKREEEEAEAKEEREEKRRRLAEESKARREKEEKEEEARRRKRVGLPELVEKEKEEAVDDDDIVEEEVLKLLEEIGEPTSLPGENHRQKVRRYRRVTTVMTTGPIPTSLKLVDEKDMKVHKMPPPEDVEATKWLYRQLASYFTMVLKEWEDALLREDKRDTFASKAAYNAMAQSKKNMTPLFRKFEKGDLDIGILEPVVEIVKAAQERRYVDANDGYLTLSIGKAAWPIGVTMVGIHERSAREKLHESDKGHVMGDEVTRKFLQSIKRCLSFAQVRWPPEDVRQLMG
ncbi:mRNA splicing protein prp18 [Pseudogymnoascus destructans]|uniref:Pre-mRNA-splicing factor 18 n=2 Tax=Pseudogymnoascus destructans TaxID=655981 RepID=L8FZM6_PSED2|nr:mRNA splicing protein prp18 [Pseudogymnoascus destructans]ELR05973.1 hypothetical protein, variant [Pseudogymnoascus destructans 20631-21]ELR05974.1 hypothetical protein GMDG_01935 [Pseudogymnoascus destructans 20631-21]OAF55231.1 mRNA splicing protein prp18 [Pseudogymnoascus destructans]